MFRGFTREDERDWGTATRCSNCGRHVTGRFARVMGDNDNEVFGCPRCSGYRELTSGMGAAAPSGHEED